MCYHSYVRHIIVCVAIHMSDILLCHMCVWPFHMSDMSEKWVLAEENCIPLTARVAFHWQWELHSTDNKHVKFDKVNNAQFAHYYQQNCCFQQSQHITLKTHTHTHKKTHTLSCLCCIWTNLWIQNKMEIWNRILWLLTKFKVGAYTQGAYTQSLQKATSCKKQYTQKNICQGANQNPAGFQILLVEIKIGISAGRTLNLASTDCSWFLQGEITM